MLKIRLQRVGRKNDPSFRFVVTDSRNATRSGKYLEVIGSYDARRGKPAVDGVRVKHWMSHGAQLTPTVHNLFISEKLIEGKKINVLPRKKPIQKEGEKVATPEKTEEKPQ